MSGETLRLLPEAKRPAVEQALRTVFGPTPIEGIELLAGGLSSALVYRFVARDKAYVLRLMMQIDAFRDPARQFTCMGIAAEAGIAPRVYYSSVEDALSITDFIAGAPLRMHRVSRADLLGILVGMIQAVHAAPLFPTLVNFLDGVDIFIDLYRATGLLPEHATADHFSRYAEIREVYPRDDRDLVSSHNDLNPNNILFDGRQAWVIDWEAAFRNDRYVDLATVANFFSLSDAEEAGYLHAYFGEALDDYKRARFFLMRQICYLFYAMGMLRLAAAQAPDAGRDENMATFGVSDFHKQVAAGAVAMASYEGQFLYGKVLLNEALGNMRTPRFVEAIRLLERSRDW